MDEPAEANPSEDQTSRSLVIPKPGGNIHHRSTSDTLLLQGSSGSWLRWLAGRKVRRGLTKSWSFIGWNSTHDVCPMVYAHYNPCIALIWINGRARPLPSLEPHSNAQAIFVWFFVLSSGAVQRRRDFGRWRTPPCHQALGRPDPIKTNTNEKGSPWLRTEELIGRSTWNGA